MKRTATDVIRRGFDNAVANWPLLILRFAEGIVMGVMIIVSIIAIVVPILVSAGISFSNFDVNNPDALAEAIANFFINHWMIIFYIIGVFTVVSFIAMALHSFVIGGIARVLVDGDRAAPDGAPRDRYRVFSTERWANGGRQTWWPIFWIYNIAYSIALLIIFAPIFVGAVIAIIAHESVPIAIGAGCLGAVITLLLMFVVGILTSICVQKAIIVCAERVTGAMEALRIAWTEARADLPRHLGVTFVMLLISFGAAGIFTTISFAFSGPMHSSHGSPAAMIGLMFLPARMVLTILNTIFSSAVALWFLGSFAALSERP
jgi:hypothetical protein